MSVERKPGHRITLKIPVEFEPVLKQAKIVGIQYDAPLYQVVADALEWWNDLHAIAAGHGLEPAALFGDLDRYARFLTKANRADAAAVERIVAGTLEAEDESVAKQTAQLKRRRGDKAP